MNSKADRKTVRTWALGMGAAVLGIFVVGAGGLPSRAEDAGFREDFSAITPGKLPDGFLVLDGQFTVKEEGGNRFLELPGSPLESFGVMFGAAGKADWAAQARFHGTGQGRRFPVFGVSLNGVAGFRVQVSPGKKAVELLKGDEVRASAPFNWESGSWTQIRVQIRATGPKSWKIEGKAWKDGTPEPATWQIVWDETEELVAGRAAVWGKPFSGTPIRFDDLKVGPLAR